MFTRTQLGAIVLLTLIASAYAVKDEKEVRAKIAGSLAIARHFARLRPENNACMVCTLIVTIVGTIHFTLHFLLKHVSAADY